MKTIIKNNQVVVLIILVLSISKANFAQSDTKQLESKIKKIISVYYMDPFEVNANSNGIVTLNGQTSTLFDKLKIEELVSRVEGVQRINNKIEVQVQTIPDDMIKYNIENELQLNNVILEPEKIIINVDNGVVNLSGTVSYFREKLMAQSIASWQDGVIDMTSSIKVLSPSAAKSDDNIKQLVSDILQNHYPLENSVNFSVSNGVIDLLGSAKSLYAKDHIQEELQHILGVKEVINEITLDKNE